MSKRIENRKFDISRREQLSFRHYQILVKLYGEGKTEHHTLEVFTTGPEQLLEMRRVFAKTHHKPYSGTIHNLIKNN